VAFWEFLGDQKRAWKGDPKSGVLGRKMPGFSLNQRA